jgi:YfiH family protein
VHGVEAVTVESSLDQEEVRARQGDIVLTHEHATGAAIRTADCVPLLIGCRATRWVAACHSGWQGCVRDAAGASVRALRAQGAHDLIAAIGPHISAAAFEVGDDVATQLLNASPDKGIVQRSGEKPHVDLRRMVRAQLRAAQLTDDAIDDVPGCTVLEPARFFSYRRDKNPSGRMLSVIVS